MKRVTIHEKLVHSEEPFTLEDNEIIVRFDPAPAVNITQLAWRWRVTYITESKE